MSFCEWRLQTECSKVLQNLLPIIMSLAQLNSLHTLTHTSCYFIQHFRFVWTLIGFRYSCSLHEQFISVRRQHKMKLELNIVHKLFDAPPNTSLQSANVSDKLTCSTCRHVNTFLNICPTISSIGLACVSDVNISEAFARVRNIVSLSHRLIITIYLYLSISIYSDLCVSYAFQLTLD